MEQKKQQRGTNNAPPKRERKDFGLKKPDDTQLKKSIAEIQKSIDSFDSKIDVLVKELNAQGDIHKKEQNEYNKRQDEINSAKSQIQLLYQQRSSILETLEPTNKKAFKQAQENNTQRKSNSGISGQTEEEMQNEIENLEKILMTSTISLKDEKKIISKIDILNQNMKIRQKAIQEFKAEQEAKLQQRQASLKAIDEDNAQINASNASKKLKLVDIDKTLSELKTHIDKLYTELKLSKTNKTYNFGETKENISKLRAEKQKFIDEKHKLNQTFKEEMDRYNAEYRIRLQKQHEKVVEMRQKKDAEQKRKQLEMKLEEAEESPYSNDYYILQNLLTYLEKLNNEKSTKQNEIPNERNGEMNKQSKLKEKSKTLRFDLQTLGYFKQFNLDVPLKEDKLENTIEIIKQKLINVSELSDKKKEIQNIQKQTIRAQLEALNETEKVES